MTYETTNWFVVDFTGIPDTVTLSSTNPISVAIPVRTNIENNQRNTFEVATLTFKQYSVAFDDLITGTVLKVEEKTPRDYMGSQSGLTSPAGNAFGFTNAYTDGGYKMPILAG